MIIQLLIIVMTVVFFKKILQWLFGDNTQGFFNFLNEAFSLSGQLIGTVLSVIWKIIRFIFQLLIYKRN